MLFGFPRQNKIEQRIGDGAGCGADIAQYVVPVGRREGEGFEHARLERRRCVVLVFLKTAGIEQADAARRPGDAFEDVFRAFHEQRAFTDEAVRAVAARVERRARRGEDLAALFEREARGDERAGLGGGLDDDDGEGKAGKSRAIGVQPKGRSLTIRPFSPMAAVSAACSGG